MTEEAEIRVSKYEQMDEPAHMPPRDVKGLSDAIARCGGYEVLHITESMLIVRTLSENPPRVVIFEKDPKA